MTFISWVNWTYGFSGGKPQRRTDIPLISCQRYILLTWLITVDVYLDHWFETVVAVWSLSRVWLFVTPWTARSTPGLPVHHQLPESTQTHVHWISDAIQPSHPLSSPSPPALNLSQHQGLFKWVSSSHQVAKVLAFQLQYQSYQWTPRTDLL